MRVSLPLLVLSSKWRQDNDNELLHHLTVDVAGRSRDLAYFGRHPPPAIANAQVLALVDMSDSRFVLVNDPDKKGPTQFKVLDQPEEPKETKKMTTNRLTEKLQQHNDELADKHDHDLTQVSFVGEERARQLAEQGVETISQLAQLTPEQLANNLDVDSVGIKTAGKIIDSAKTISNMGLQKITIDEEKLTPKTIENFKKELEGLHYPIKPVRKDLFNPQKQAETLNRELTKLFLDVVHKHYAYDNTYVAGYGQYRISSVASCPRLILLTKFERRFLTPKQRTQARQIIHENNLGRGRLGGAIKGSIDHIAIQKAFAGHTTFVDAERTVRIQTDTIELVGHYDLLLDFEGIKIVIDIKTAGNWTWKNKVPDKAHFNQLMLYQHALGGIMGAIAYQTREKGEIKVIVQAYDGDRATKLIGLFEQLYDKYEYHMQLPVIEDRPEYFNPDKAPCKFGRDIFCKYYQYCWGDVSE